MERIVMRFVMAMVFVCTTGPASSDAGNLVADSSELTQDQMRDLAIEAVDSFHDALEDGDVDRIATKVGGGFQLSRQRTLESGSYGDELRRLYHGSEYSVSAIEIHPSGQATVVGRLKGLGGQSVAITLDLTLEYSEKGVRYLVTGEHTTSRL